MAKWRSAVGLWRRRIRSGVAVRVAGIVRRGRALRRSGSGVAGEAGIAVAGVAVGIAVAGIAVAARLLRTTAGAARPAIRTTVIGIAAATAATAAPSGVTATTAATGRTTVTAA